MMHSRFPEQAHRAAAARACRQMWAAVLVQAMRDIFTPSKAERWEVARKRLEHDQALSWLGSADFHKVCALAGLDGSAVEARVRRRLAQVAARTWCPDEVMSTRPNISRGNRLRGAA